MTPLTFTSSSSSSSTTTSSSSLTESEIYSVLSDQRSSIQSIASVFIQVFRQRQRNILNSVIHTIVARSGEFILTGPVIDLLRETGISVQQCRDGSVMMAEVLITCQTPQRNTAIREALEPFLPPTVCSLINSYEKDEIEISTRNAVAMTNELCYGSQQCKEKIIRSTILEADETFLRQLFDAGVFQICTLDLSDIDLSGLKLVHPERFDFSYWKMDNIKLNNVNLSGSAMRFTRLTMAGLYGTNLNNVRLCHADLRHADLRRSSLRGADLADASLDYAMLSGADLRGAKLECADLYAADLRGADLRGADLRSARLIRADLRGAVLDGAKLRGIALGGTKSDDPELHVATHCDVYRPKTSHCRIN